MSAALSNIYIWGGAVSAALIAAALSYLGLIIAKENKISEFRQAWIDSLREDISQFIAATRLIAQTHDLHNGATTLFGDELLLQESMRPHYIASSQALSRIRLRVNPDDSDPKLKKLNQALLARLQDLQMATYKNNYKEALTISNDMHNYAAPVLKAEWERVKRGETTYVASRWVAIGLLLATIALVVWGLFRS